MVSAGGNVFVCVVVCAVVCVCVCVLGQEMVEVGEGAGKCLCRNIGENTKRCENTYTLNTSTNEREGEREREREREKHRERTTKLSGREETWQMDKHEILVFLLVCVVLILF